MTDTIKTDSSSLNAHITQLITEAVDKWSVEDEKDLKLIKAELAIVRKELTEIKKSQGFISIKYKDLKSEHDQLL